MTPLDEISAMTLIKLFAEFVIGLAGFCTAAIFMYTLYKKITVKMLDDKFEAQDQKIDDLKTHVDGRFDDMEQRHRESDYEACKNFLVHALHDIEQGVDDEILKERVHEQYKHYKRMDGNSYIESRIRKLQDEGKL